MGATIPKCHGLPPRVSLQTNIYLINILKNDITTVSKMSTFQSCYSFIGKYIPMSSQLQIPGVFEI